MPILKRKHHVTETPLGQTADRPATPSHFAWSGPIFGSGDEEPIVWKKFNGQWAAIPQRAFDDDD